jgi:hypothetical protein
MWTALDMVVFTIGTIYLKGSLNGCGVNFEKDVQIAEQSDCCSAQQKPALEISTSSARLAHKTFVDFM